MALSMDEQRMLAEIERHLAAEEPGLASNLARLRKPGRAGMFRSTRARVIGSLFTVAVVAMVSLVVYAMLPFRSGGRTTGHQPVTTSSTGPGQVKIGAAPGTGTGSSAARISNAKSGATGGSTSSTAAQSSAQASSASPSSSAGAPSASAAYAEEHGQSPG